MNTLPTDDLEKLNDMAGHILSLVMQLKTSNEQFSILEDLHSSVDALSDRVTCLLDDLA